MTESSPEGRTRSVSWWHVILLLGVAVVAWTVDFFSKEWILANFQEYESREIVGEALRFTFVRNPGAAFSFASGMTWIFTILSASVTIAIIFFAPRLRSVGWALVLGGLLGGTTGNLFDRLTREPGGLQGHVIDFIHVWGFPAIFNVADMAIVCSMGGLIVLMLRGDGIDGSRPKTDEPGQDKPGQDQLGQNEPESGDSAADEPACDELDSSESAAGESAPDGSGPEESDADEPKPSGSASSLTEDEHSVEREDVARDNTVLDSTAHDNTVLEAGEGRGK